MSGPIRHPCADYHSAEVRLGLLKFVEALLLLPTELQHLSRGGAVEGPCLNLRRFSNASLRPPIFSVNATAAKARAPSRAQWWGGWWGGA